MGYTSIQDLNKFVPDVKFELIQIKDLTSAQDYQRNISMKHVERAAENFDPYQINPVKVSRRNGINYVFNGQHTIEIIALVSGSRETPVWCMVYENLTYEQEADIFANQLKYTKSLLPYEIFVASIEAGNDKELFINDIVESYNLRISATKGPGCVCAISALEKIFVDYGSEILDLTLRVIIGTWEGMPDSMSASMLKGVAIMLFTFGENFNEEIFKEKLGRLSIKYISRMAKDRGNGAMGYAEAMTLEYNKKMKANTLRFSKLSEHQNKKRRDRRKENAQLFAMLDEMKRENGEDEIISLSESVG